MLIDRIKRRLHREIVADPVLHAIVINLYMNGEEYPHLVDDYFPIHAAEDAALAASMRQHVAEEDKHVRLYARAIEKLGQPVLRLPMADIFNAVIVSHTPASFAIAATDDRDARTLKLAHFLAHAHYLEKRIERSLNYHVDACAHSPVPYTAKAVGAVLSDEMRHVRYTREAVLHLLPRRVAHDVLRVHRRAERKANLEFSSTQLGRLMRDHRRRFSRGGGIVYRGCASLMNVLAAHV